MFFNDVQAFSVVFNGFEGLAVFNLLGHGSLDAISEVTSKAGDHNGAFEGLDATHIGRNTMCARMLQMSQHYNVVYKRLV